MKRVGASAPGKALLCGEYAVLEGGPAVVAAVGRRAVARWSDTPTTLPPEVEATLERARATCGSTEGSLALDVSALRQDGHKLGLGSSAAGAVAAAGAVFATCGHDLRDSEAARGVLDCALQGHAAVAPSGSGVDVAASTFGGFLRFARSEAGFDVRPLRPPHELGLSLVWTGHAARTSDLVAKVHELRRVDPAQYERRMGRLLALAASFADAFEHDEAAGIVSAADAYGHAMRELGDAASAPIVEARLSLAAQLAARYSGSAKPCGAGGGDVAIAFFADADATSAFELACGDEGLHPIHVSWGAEGVSAI